ncbi:hypothetical protein, partial [Streptomyces sp. NPDC059003]|uniref:hypothetical protein n=1 Tax=Streptomyces sp. NPDC059003 TaxID=3346691 RepID=UPI0036932756
EKQNATHESTSHLKTGSLELLANGATTQFAPWPGCVNAARPWSAHRSTYRFEKLGPHAADARLLIEKLDLMAAALSAPRW